MAAQVFAPQFLLVRTAAGRDEVINTNDITRFYPEDHTNNTIVHVRGFSAMTVNRKFSDFVNDVAAKNCR